MTIHVLTNPKTAGFIIKVLFTAMTNGEKEFYC